MLNKKSHPFLALITFLIFFIVIIFNSAEGFSLAIKNAVPLTPLPLLVAYSVFSDVRKSAIAGFLLGACVDSVANGSYCFNTIAMLIIGVAVCLAANNLFNKNIRAVTALSLITAVLYFAIHWLVFRFFGTTSQESLQYLINYSMPSALYTSIFILPFYFIFKHLNKLNAK